VEWCEERKCQTITTPANTWSNVAYVVAGLYMMRRAGKSTDLKLFGPAAIATGVFSGLYHASFTKLFQWFDFIGMYMFCLLPVIINLRRLRYLRRDQQGTVYGVAVCLCGALTSMLQSIFFPIQLIVVALVAVAAGTEYKAMQRAQNSVNIIVRYRFFFVAAGLLAVGFVCSMLDMTRVWCNPHNHIVQGHAVWHLLTAAALVCQFVHYQMLEEDAAATTSAGGSSQLTSAESSLSASSMSSGAGQEGRLSRWTKSHKRATSVDLERMFFQSTDSEEVQIRNRSCENLKELANMSRCAPLIVA
jgi:hypothetical protein